MKPLFISPRVKFKTHMLLGSPPETGSSASKSVWINSETFMQVLRHFTKRTKCSKENPVMRIAMSLTYKSKLWITVDKME